MVSAIFLNVKGLVMDIWMVGLELMFTSKCLMKSTTMEKGMILLQFKLYYYYQSGTLSSTGESCHLIFSLLACSLIGKVAADNSHKWVFNDSPNVNDPSFTSSWNVSLDLVSLTKRIFRSPLFYAVFVSNQLNIYQFSQQPRAWDLQFNTGIQVFRIKNHLLILD